MDGSGGVSVSGMVKAEDQGQCMAPPQKNLAESSERQNNRAGTTDNRKEY